MQKENTKPTQEENNRLIAEFMGEKYSTGLMGQPLINHKTIGYTPIRYHESWDWLMPVVEKIEATTIKMQIDQNIDPDFEPDIREEEWLFSVRIENCQCMINQDVLPQYYGTDRDFLKTYDCRNEGKISKLEATYNACIEFIGWLKLKQKGGEACEK